MKMVDTRFWMWIVAITAIGTLGSVLFKYGTNAFGTLTLDRLLRFDFSKASVLGLALFSFGAAAALLGGYLLRDASFAAEFLFYPAIFLALAMLFVSRFLIGIPLSVTGLGRLNALLTVISIVTTTVASALIFKEAFSVRVILGFLLGMASILLIGEM
jgi:drug/metabolite transporter (DMT)-like permease